MPNLENRILITGDREWSDTDLMFDAMANLYAVGTTIIDGTARGADTLANFNAQRLGMVTKRYPAWWKCEDYEKDQGRPCKLADGRHEAYHGRAAGVLRNQRMLEQSNPTEVWAFHDDLDNSRGTKDMVQRALKAKLMVTVFSHLNPHGVVL